MTSPDPQAHSQLDDTLSKLKITRGELEATKVTPDIIQRAIKKLKRGKSDGEALTSDHLFSAPTSLSKILAPIVTSLHRRGHMPSSLSDTIVQPIPKGGNKDYSLSVNHQGIALASCLIARSLNYVSLSCMVNTCYDLNFSWTFQHHMHWCA